MARKKKVDGGAAQTPKPTAPAMPAQPFSAPATIAVGAIPEGKIVDFLTGKHVKDKPEEYVRQNIEKALVRQYRYVPSDCTPEFKISMGSKKPRVDIVIFDPGEPHKQENAFILIETKKAGTDPQDKEDGIGQLQSYIAACPNARYGMWTNGDDRFCFARRIEGGKAKTEPISDIPSAGQSEADALKPKRKDLMPATADNLLFAFRRCHNYIAGAEGVEKRDAFWELLKIIFCKIEDERSRDLQFFVTPTELSSEANAAAIWLSSLSHDMIRIEIPDEAMRHYVLAFLESRSGQHLIRRDKTGSVIDHLSDNHLANQEIPVFAEPIFSDVAATMGQAVKLREEARLALAALIEGYQALLPVLKRERPMRLGWTVRSVALTGRVDAAHYDPLVEAIRAQLLALGGVKVGDVATVTQPKRYKRLYTTPEFGRPIISGAQLLQSKPVHPQYILEKSFDNVADYELNAGWIAYPSDGRAEEGLGTPAYVNADRDGWLASNMVGRIIPNPETNAGWLYLALKTPHAQRQFKAQASGSVVDHTYPWDMECVVLPPALGIDGKEAIIAWERFSEAQALEDKAADMMDIALSGPPIDGV